jgi:DNA ligase-1
LPAAYLVTGKLGPDYEGVEMSVGSKAIGGAIQEATGVTRQKLGSMYRELGDLGDVAQACRHNQVLVLEIPLLL